MRFLTDVESGNVGGVQLLLRKGQVSPNLNYLGVYPLNLCLERGDIDMAAVLLTAGADPIMKTDPLNKPDKKITNAMEFAEMISKDKKHSFRMEAQVMLEMFNSEEKLKQRFAAVQVRLQKELDRDTVLAKRFGLLTLAVGALGFGYWYYLY
jgi:ankyrin repeat protein